MPKLQSFPKINNSENKITSSNNFDNETEYSQEQNKEMVYKKFSADDALRRTFKI